VVICVDEWSVVRLSILAIDWGISCRNIMTLHAGLREDFGLFWDCDSGR
jgi:hypothetical protein